MHSLYYMNCGQFIVHCVPCCSDVCLWAVLAGPGPPSWHMVWSSAVSGAVQQTAGRERGKRYHLSDSEFVLYFNQIYCKVSLNSNCLNVFFSQDMNNSKLFSDEAANIYERAIGTLLKKNMLLYFSFADYEEVSVPPSNQYKHPFSCNCGCKTHRLISLNLLLSS